MRIELPWPPVELNPNFKGHWAAKARATKRYRGACCYLTLASKTKPPEGTVKLKVTFYPPDARKRDRTNMEASMKAAFDGLADAWKVNDILFAPVYHLAEPVKGGKVIIET